MRSSLHAPIYRGRHEYVGRPGMSPALAALVAAGLLRREHRVLDVGCGRGEDLMGLVRLGFRDLVGLDRHARSIAAARRRVGAQHVEWRLATLDALPGMPARSFDWVLDTFLVNNLPRDDVAEYLHRLASLLPPGGGLVLHSKAGARSAEARGRGGLHSPFFTRQGPPAFATFAEWDPRGKPSYATGFVQVMRRNARRTKSS